jgi:hypothetical protein
VFVGIAAESGVGDGCPPPSDNPHEVIARLKMSQMAPNRAKREIELRYAMLLVSTGQP